MTIFNLFITVLIATSIVAVTNSVPRTIKFGLTISLLTAMIYMGTGVATASSAYEYSDFVSWQGSLGYYDSATTVMERPVYQAGQSVYVSRPMYREQIQVYESVPLYVNPSIGVNIQLPPINVRW